MSQPTESTRSVVEPAPRHRKAKAILAIAAGTALLLGGGGTYAYWSTEKALTATQVNSGNLDLGLGAGTWKLKGALQAAPTDLTSLTNVKIVPGDVLTLTQPLTVTLTGDTLVANLKAELGSTFSASVLGQNLDVKLTMPANYGTSTSDTSYRLTSADSGTPNATLTITFRGGTSQQTAVNTSVNLSDVKFSLSQAFPTP
ncbi:alternate-type signal peptide domain-containing protein [uncultured Microbacterium sp.]|uniref:alternate-type signal peptide domain-containing protein n=1 Tax=uncultured Microbacterium sp. TaxID=191216 RepID=UPI0025E86BF4|nr:alternate-type signal peptide domain-containing protein [uncultured Microbacterium sp.]